MGAKKYSDACPKLEEVTRRVPDGLGAKITLGECYEAVGRLGSAHGQYTMVLRAATSAGNTERAQEAEKKIAALAPRASRVVFSVPPGSGALAGFALTLDGVAVPPSEWASGVAVDVGTHVVQASAAGRSSWVDRPQVPRDGIRLSVAVPELAESGSEPRAATRRVAWRFAGGLAGVGLGGISVALGVVSGVQVLEAQAALEPYRDALPQGEHVCTSTAPSLDPAPLAVVGACNKRLFGPLQIVFYGAAAVLGGVGVYFLATSGAPGQARSVAWRVAPVAGPGFGGMAVVGTW
jgi:hypothetical protein